MCTRDDSHPHPLPQLHYQHPTTYQPQPQRQHLLPSSHRRPSLSYLPQHQLQSFPPPPLLQGGMSNPHSAYSHHQLSLGSGYEYALSSDRIGGLGMTFDSEESAGGPYEDERTGEDDSNSLPWRGDDSYSDLGRSSRGGGESLVEWQGCDSASRFRQEEGDEFGDGGRDSRGGNWTETTTYSSSHQLVGDAYDHPHQHHSSSLPVNSLSSYGDGFEYSSNPSYASASSNGRFSSSTPIPFKQPFSLNSYSSSNTNPSLPPRSFSYDGYGPSSSASYVHRPPHPIRSTTVSTFLAPPPPVLSTSLLPPPSTTTTTRNLSHHRPTHQRQDSFDHPNLAPLLSPSSNSTFSSQSVTTNSTVFSTPNTSYTKAALISNGNAPLHPQSPTLYQSQEGLVSYSPRGEEHETERGGSLLLSFEHHGRDEDAIEHERDEFSQFGFESDQEMDGGGGGGEGLVDLDDVVVDAGEGGSRSSSSKRKAGDQLDEGRSSGGREKDEAKVENEPDVILTKAGKPRRKKGKAIVACEECRRLKMRCDNKVPCSSCIGRGCPSICPHGTLANLKGKRLVLSDTVSLHARITALETALAISFAKEHPSWSGKKGKSSSSSSVERIHPLLVKEALVAETDSKAK